MEYLQVAHGQILSMYLIYKEKIETHKARATALSIFCIVSIINVIGSIYVGKVALEMKYLIILVICGLVGGIIGSKFSLKLQSEKLNLISGIMLVVFSLINIFKVLR